MSRQSTITPDGRWYKGNTHAHTNLSDGAFTPGELVDRFKERQAAIVTAAAKAQSVADYLHELQESKKCEAA